MKSKRKRNAGILVAMLLILTMVFFAGCGGTNDELTDGTTDNPPVTNNDATNPQNSTPDESTLNNNGITGGATNTTGNGVTNMVE